MYNNSDNLTGTTPEGSDRTKGAQVSEEEKELRKIRKQ